MVKKPEVSTKRLAIDKANAQMVLIVAMAAFVSIFCLVAAKAAFSSNLYQQKVFSAKNKANKQLENNLKAWEDLAESYKSFDSAGTNVISGTREGSGDNDGPNSKIILNALPSVYDFPALTSSVEKILTLRGIPVGSITGTDDQLNQQENESSPTPEAVEMPFSFTSAGVSYDGVTKLIDGLQKSIRPMQIDTLDIAGGGNNINVTVNGHSYYQPGKSVSITKKVVK